jgi:hypothetical protein
MAAPGDEMAAAPARAFPERKALRVSAVSPASRNSAFQRPTDCSPTFSCRAASAIVISPASTLSTIRVFRPARSQGALPMVQILLQGLIQQAGSGTLGA